MSAIVNSPNGVAIATSGAWHLSANRLGSFHTGGIHVVMGDGSVHFVSDYTDINVLRQLAARDDGFPVGGLPNN